MAGKNNPFDHDKHHESMENLFEENFSRVIKNADNEEEEKDPANLTGKYKIDLLDGNDEDQEDLNINNDDDDDEKEVKNSVKQNQF